MAAQTGPSGLPDLPPEQAWYTESVRQSLYHSLVLKRTLFSGSTAFQNVEIIDTDPFGKTLVLDGKTQSTESDEFIYHEALVHPALIACESPANVFIAGGGEGATLREVLSHRCVQQVVMTDLDGELVELCRRHLPEWHKGAFDDPRTSLVIGDAQAELERHGREFDVILVDVTDPTEMGPALPLFTSDFYAMAAGRLKLGGVLVTQAGPGGLHMTKPLTAIRHTISQVFEQATVYTVEVVSFGSTWGFVIAGNNLNIRSLSEEVIDRRIAKNVSRPLRFYDGETHSGMLAIPKWLRASLAAEEHLTRSDRPVVTD